MPNFRSGFERTLYQQLKSAQVQFGYETLQIPYTTSHVYKPDFVLDNGIIIEAKGVMNRYDKHETAKMVWVKKQHPELDIRFVFMNADTKVNGLKSTHAQWADRHGFPWASERIPDEWLKHT